MRKRLSSIGFVLLAALAVAVTAGSQDRAAPYFHVTIFAHTTHDLDSVVWTGEQFLYVVNTQNTVWSAPPAGMPLTLFVTMKALVEETRCIASPGTHGFPAAEIFCHSPDNKIYEISANGASIHVFATLPAPYPPASDGALIFDDLGHFGYQLSRRPAGPGAAKPRGRCRLHGRPDGNRPRGRQLRGPGWRRRGDDRPAEFRCARRRRAAHRRAVRAAATSSR